MKFHKKASFCYNYPYMQSKIIEKYFFFGLLSATIVFVFLIFRPFWIVLMLGASFSIVLYPVYKWLKKSHMPNWSASLLTLFFFIIFLFRVVDMVFVFLIPFFICSACHKFIHTINTSDILAFLLKQLLKSFTRILLN